MNNKNLLESKNDNDGTKINSPLGLLFLLPILIIVAVYIIIPLFNTLYISFTTYNYIERPTFIGLGNYRRLWSDAVFRVSLSNTVTFTLFSVIIATGLSFFMAWSSSTLHKGLKTLLCILFSLVSVSYIIPSSLAIFFSSSPSGFMNNYLLKTETILLPILFFQWPDYIKVFSTLVPVLIGLGPMYTLFTMAFQKQKKLRSFTHIAVSMQIVISILSSFTVMKLIGFPSVDYSGHTLLLYIFDYMNIRFEIGYGSALTVILGILIFILVAVFNYIVWLVYGVINQVKEKQNGDFNAIPKNNSALSILVFIVSILLFSILMLPFVQTLFESLKPLEELYAFPKTFLPLRPTLENYISAMDNPQFNQSISNSIILFIMSTGTMFIISALSGAGFLLFRYSRRKVLLYSIAFLFILSPILLLSSVSIRYFLKENLSFLLFQSPVFGLTIYFSAMIIDSAVKGHLSLKDFMGSARSIVLACLKLLCISMLSSLTLWFDTIYIPHTIMFSTLTSLAQKSISPNGNVVLLVLSLILPIIIILISVPIVSNITYSKKE